MEQRRRTSVNCAVIVSLGVVAFVQLRSAERTSAAPPDGSITGSTITLPQVSHERSLDFPGLHNVVAYHEGYYSGSVPEGEAGFDTLTTFGVKTIISVDGAEPDLHQAKARGIRYIHLPIGYNGFSEERRVELARATRDALKQGPVYIHCHHGKHRSAGAAAAVVVSLGLASPEDMTRRMKVSGTSPNYKGLYACTAGAKPLTDEVLNAAPANFPEVARPTGFVKGMIEIDEIAERLKAIEAAGWSTPKDHPDLVPVAEAGRMADLFRTLKDGDYVKNKPADFADLMAQNGAEAGSLEGLLEAGEKDTAKLSQQHKLIIASCKECHVKYRD